MIGNEFTERYGYNGYYFYSGKDITDKIVTDNQVNTDEVGEYQITYSLN